VPQEVLERMKMNCTACFPLLIVRYGTGAATKVGNMRGK
jgi:hypothetical protein